MIKLPLYLKEIYFSLKNRFSYQNKKNNSGQALLIILLILAGALTVVLSTASRSVTDIQTTGIEEDSIRAFNAAEFGIEQALLQNTIGSGTLANDASYDVSIPALAGHVRAVIYPEKLYSGDVATFWFVSHDEDGNLTCDNNGCFHGTYARFCFGIAGTSYTIYPAIEVSIIYDENAPNGINDGDFSGIKVDRYAFDSLNSRIIRNNFDRATSGCSRPGLNGYLSYMNNDNVTLPVVCRNIPGCLLMARVRSLYNVEPNKVGVFSNPTGGTGFPKQGVEIESTGIAGDSQRKIQVMQTYGEVPGIFSSAIYSKGAILK